MLVLRLYVVLELKNTENAQKKLGLTVSPTNSCRLNLPVGLMAVRKREKGGWRCVAYGPKRPHVFVVQAV